MCTSFEKLRKQQGKRTVINDLRNRYLNRMKKLKIIVSQKKKNDVEDNNKYFKCRQRKQRKIMTEGM